MDNEEVLARHLADLARQSENRNCYMFSGFLSLAEQSVLEKASRTEKFRYSLYGGSLASERQIAVFGREEDLCYEPPYPVVVVSIAPKSEKYGEALSHRDYLGAILNLGIDRELTGDIVIRGKNAWLFCLDSIAEFLCDSLTKVRHTDVTLSIVTGEVPELAPTLQEVTFNVASERLDAVASELTGIPRTKIKPLFSEQRVAVNGRLITDSSKTLKEGDVLTIRGFGKAIYDGQTGMSKKGRLYVTLRKYV